MTAFLLDTAAIIGLLERNSRSVRGALSRVTVDPKVSVLTLGELEHGAQHAEAAQDERRQLTLRRAKALPMIAIDAPEVAECFGFISRSTRAGVIDRWLVACAVVEGLDLLTEDHGMSALIDDVPWNDRWRRPDLTLCSSV
jgi:predicted nucleic acid-binding protein